MKKTYHIDLNGLSFCIDEDAYIKLQNYLEALEKHYLEEEEGREIMADIECRISELFSELLQQTHRQVVTKENIDHVIGIMGTPSAIINDESEKNASGKKIRKLYRDTDHQILTGIAAGIAAYWAIPVLYVRIGLILFGFFYGITIPIYIILLIILPKAQTARQKMEMKGDKINISNIERNIRDSYSREKKRGKIQALLESARTAFYTFFKTLWHYMQRILSIALSILSVGGIIAGTFFFLSICYLLFFPAHIFGYFNAPVLFQLIPATPFLFIKITLFLVLNIPVILIVYGAICHLFKFNVSRVFILLASGLWFIGCLLGLFVSIHQGLRFSSGYQNSTNVPLEFPENHSKKLYVKMNNLPDKSHKPNLKVYADRHIFNIIMFDSTYPPTIIQEMGIVIDHNSNTSVPELWINKRARGTSRQEAIENLDHIDVKWLFSNDTLYLNNFFTVPQNYWRAQDVTIGLSIPEGYIIHFLNIEQGMIDSYIFQDELLPLKQQSFQMQGQKLKRISNTTTK